MVQGCFGVLIFAPIRSSLTLEIRSHPHRGILPAEGNSRMYETKYFFRWGEGVEGLRQRVLCTIDTHDCVDCFLTFLQPTSVMCVAGQGVVPGSYVMAEGPGGVPIAFPVQHTGSGVTVPYGHAQIVSMSPQGVTQVTDQPPPYDQIFTT